MQPLILLISGLPIFAIVFIIIAIIRLIVRLAKKSNNDQTYTPPPPSQYNQHGPQGTNQNPGQNPYQGTYHTPTPAPNPYQQSQPTSQPQSYKPANESQTYSKPDYGNTPLPSANQQRRSTAIPGTYSTYIDDQPKRNNTAVVIAIVIAVAALGAGAAIFLAGTGVGASMTKSEFILQYQNPTDGSYLIVLDDWDTIKVEPHTASVNLEYAFDQNADTLHWKMLEENGAVVADTFILKAEILDWQTTEQSRPYSSSPTILLNPSRSEFVFWTVWYNDSGSDEISEMKVGDSTYFIDATTTRNPFIFDTRNPEFATKLELAEGTSDDEQAQFLISVNDLPALYAKIYSSDRQYEMLRNYRNSLQSLFTEAHDVIMEESRYTPEDVSKVYVLDSLTPAYVDGSTGPLDFREAISYLAEEQTLFKSAAPARYRAVMDSANIVLNAIAEQPQVVYPALRYVGYVVSLGSSFGTPNRQIGYETARDPKDGAYYE
jgi:hypothetical protein